MKNKKTLGFILLIIGTVLSSLSLLFAPVAVYGVYLLLNVYKAEMSKGMKIFLSIVVGLAIPMLIATFFSFLLY